MSDLGLLYVYDLGKVEEGKVLLRKALDGFSAAEVRDPQHCLWLREILKEIEEENPVSTG